MNVEQALEFVEQKLLCRNLTPVERSILCQTWTGQNYSAIAQSASYSSAHIKEVAARLWHDLSEVVGQKVTKKNLQLILIQSQNQQTDRQTSIATPNIAAPAAAKVDVPSLPSQTTIEFPGSPVPLNSSLYINRPPIEQLAYNEITQPGCAIRIKAARRMGKSSLLIRILDRAKTLGYRTANLDFQEADNAIFDSLDKFLRWFCVNISRQLKIPPKLDDYWDEDMGSKVSCKIYFEAYLLAQIDRPVAIALNEVNRVFEHPQIAQDFLPMLRFWHEVAKQDKNWEKLRLVVVHTTEVYVPLKINQSPFNVGLSLSLPAFNAEQVGELAMRYGLDWEDSNKTEKLMAMVGGHPYLIDMAFYHLRQGKITLEELLATAPTLSGIYSDYLRSHLAMLENEPQLAAALRQAIATDASVQVDAIAAYKLESMGLVKLDGNRLKLTCELYRLYFRAQLNQSQEIEDLPLSVKDNPSQPKKFDLSDPSSQLDPLTQLASRQVFDRYLNAKWQQWAQSNIVVSLLLCEIDYFKVFNDTYGYQIGDAYLQLIAKIIQDCSQNKADSIARYGSVEFGILLTETTAKIAVDLAENIRSTVRSQTIVHNLSNLEGCPIDILTVSLGVATTTPSHKNSPDMLVNAAIEAVARSKARDRNCVTFSQIVNEDIWN